jgi:hypothetical protein
MIGATIVLWGSLDLLRRHGLAFGSSGIEARRGREDERAA